MSVVDAADARVLPQEVDVFDGDMGPVQVGDVDEELVLPDPVPDTALHVLPVEDLNPHLHELRGIGLLVEEVVPQELYVIALLQEHADVLIGGLGAGVFVPGGHVVIDHQDAGLLLGTVSCGKGIGISRIPGLLLKLLLPLLPELLLVHHLVLLQALSVHVGAVGDPLEVNHHRLRLVYHPFSVLSHLKGQVAVLAVGRSEALVKAPDLLPEGSADHDGCAGDVVHLL